MRKAVVGWEGLYEVDPTGAIHALPRLILLKNGRSRWYSGKRRKAFRMVIGYHQLVLSHQGRKETVYVHRVVALAFLGTPEPGRDHVNHINGDKFDDRLENLEWVSRSENMQHSYDVLGRVAAASGRFGVENKGSMPVVGIPVLDNGPPIKFAGLQEAGRAGFSPGNIHSCIQGDRHTHKGFRWYYSEGIASQQTLESSRAVKRGVPPGCRLT